MHPSGVIDAHAHVLTKAMIAAIQAEAPSLGMSLAPLDADGDVLQVAGIVQKPFPKTAYDLDRRLADLDRMGIERQLVCNIPHTFLYESDASLAETVSIIQNDGIADFVRAMPERFAGLATVPLQAPEKAAAELRRAMRTRGLIGVHVGSNIGGRNLDEPELDIFWEAADELGAFVLVHPHKIAAGARLEEYYLKNLIGNPLETTIAGAALIFGGVIERFPNITFCLVHAGGFVPYQIGRFRHGWDVRAEPHKRMRGTPEESFARLMFDTITHDDAALDYLVRKVGASQIVFGTDYPFDMGDYRGVERIRRLGLPRQDEQAVLGGSISRFWDGAMRAGTLQGLAAIR